MTFGSRQAQVNKILFRFWPDPSLAQGMIYASQFATSRIYLGHGFDVFICIHTFSHWTSSAYETPKTIIRLRSNGKTHLEGINRAHSIYLLLLSHLQFIGWFSFLHIITTLLLMIGSTYILSLWTKAFTAISLENYYRNMSSKEITPIDCLPDWICIMLSEEISNHLNWHA